MNTCRVCGAGPIHDKRFICFKESCQTVWRARYDTTDSPSGVEV